MQSSSLQAEQSRSWSDKDEEEDYISWEKEVETKEEILRETQPIIIEKNTKLIVTVRGRYGDSSDQTVKKLTPRSILMLIDDENFEILKIVDNLGRAVEVEQVEDLFEVKEENDEDTD
ncbi:MAG: hypothetical protein ACYTFW_16895 [Planctomycetota bacterium]